VGRKMIVAAWRDLRPAPESRAVRYMPSTACSGCHTAFNYENVEFFGRVQIFGNELTLASNEPEKSADGC
jgi:hypothetical protein